ncbi:serine hydrolase domain-containing protein [Actinosynnema sp. NPDC047251]|uniref:Beta-lactamase n=1 Tax=Saccharothrix espanaensis (strain ATCC 51144 / DSM 44229 / JCM 9112 / NBRC 15066 / NRRL 15764) TaxID=1179773 RepID=K0JW43_SACES|nr:serine hydrolase domain-containing protein [Saccharothrix espanaensis]CCH28418.1 beta-lactamase [Saccharothrix espanaensis DSM 44229]
MGKTTALAAALLVATIPVVAATTATTAAAHAADPAALDRRVAEYVADHADAAAYPGVAVAITKGDRVVHVSGHGRTSTGAAVTAKTRMPIASVSKSFTALAVVQLAERGALDLDTPVARYVPEFHPADERGARITVRHLLDHTSGITDRTLPEKSRPQPSSPADAVTRVNPTALASDPGTEHRYTNTNYHLAALVVERASGEPFGDYLRRHVFEPAGMHDTTSITTTPDDLPDDVVKGHVHAYGASIPATEPTRFVAGSDGVITTAEDMAKWLVVQSNGGRAASGAQLVSAAGITAMHTASAQSPSYALGWATNGGKVRHSGIWFTYCAGQLLLPSGYGVAVIANTGFALGNEGTSALEDGLAALADGGTPAEPPSTRLVTELVLGALTLLSLVLGVLALRRAWPRRALWQVVVRMVPRLVPVAALILLPTLLGLLVGGGRDITLFQVAHYSPALVVWLAVSSALNLAVLATRAARLLRERTGPADRAPEPQPAGR